MACIKKRRGKWVVDYRDASGRRRWETMRNRDAAKDRLAEILKGRGQVIDTKRTFREYAEECMETYAKAHVKQSTLWEYESVLRNHLLPAFGPVPFSKISREMVKKLLAEKIKAGLSRSHVRNIICPIREMYNHAIDDGLVSFNPASRIGRFNQRRAEDRKIDPLTREEVGILLTTVKQRLPQHYPLLLLAARTGLRAGEIAAHEPAAHQHPRRAHGATEGRGPEARDGKEAGRGP